MENAAWKLRKSRFISSGSQKHYVPEEMRSK